MKTLLTLFVLLFTSSLFANCTSGDCVNGSGIYSFDDGDEYVGEFKSGEYHGEETFDKTLL